MCASDFERGRLKSLRENSVLYQGTTLVVLQVLKSSLGFCP